MALENPLHQIDTALLNRTAPRVPWNVEDFDGVRIRNIHEQALGNRDEQLLEWIRAVRNSSTANISPRFPFKEDATLTPTTAEAFDFSGNLLNDFIVSVDDKMLSLSFVKDLKLILASDFADPYLSKIILREATDPNTNLIQVFIDIEISARYRPDQTNYPVLILSGRAYNDVQDNSSPSSRDNLSFNMVAQQVAGRDFFNGGVIEFSFLGAVQSQTESSWSNGKYNDIMVEGFSTVPNLGSIVFTFDYSATKIAQLAYNNLGDISQSVPFLRKVQYWPFFEEANAAPVLQQYITDLSVSGPADELVYIKRIRRFEDASTGLTIYRVVLAYDVFDANQQRTGNVNIGVCDIWDRPSKVWIFEIQSLGSNTIAGEAPNWFDEVTGNTVDSYGKGFLRIVNFEVMENLFNALIQAEETIDTEVDEEDRTLAPPATIGTFPDPDTVIFRRNNTVIEAMTTSIAPERVQVTRIPVDPQVHVTRNERILINDISVTKRISYGNEAQMRNFYGIGGAESLTDNTKIDPEDEWFDTSANALKRYQLVQGRYIWRVI